MKKQFSVSSYGTRLAVFAGIVLLTLCVAPAMGAIQYGLRCQGDFQNGWLPDINVYPFCDNFINQIGSNYIDFYYNLHGAQPDFYYGEPQETSRSAGGIDSVDFFVMSTHGGIANNDADYAGYAMWDDHVLAWTPSMRLGSRGREVKALATFSCDTLKNSDGKLPNRWGSAFAGGLKMLVGGGDLLWDADTDTIGYDFAMLMQTPYPIGTSWLNAVYNNDSDNNPAIANTGANKSDCWNRQQVGLSNLLSEPVLRDGKVGYYCWASWGAH